MTQIEFENHGWKTTDKVVYRDEIYPILKVDFLDTERPINIRTKFSDEFSDWPFLSEIELYQPIHEGHTSLLTEPS